MVPMRAAMPRMSITAAAPLLEVSDGAAPVPAVVGEVGVVAAALEVELVGADLVLDAPDPVDVSVRVKVILFAAEGMPEAVTPAARDR